MRRNSSQIFYDAFAPVYAEYSKKRESYLSAVDAFIVENVIESSSIIDLGAGDGRRSKKISDLVGARKLVLVDNSENMLGISRTVDGARVLMADITQEDSFSDEKFDIVLFLWNVLGHIPTETLRIRALRNAANLLADNGKIFIDVNNRYNQAYYGKLSLIRNIISDCFFWRRGRGDFPLNFNFKGVPVRTSVHVFNPIEMEILFRKSGLKVEKRFSIDYASGKRGRNPFRGQLVFSLSKR
jgi:SAM-dependent methyltransferase